MIVLFTLVVLVLVCGEVAVLMFVVWWLSVWLLVFGLGWGCLIWLAGFGFSVQIIVLLCFFIFWFGFILWYWFSLVVVCFCFCLLVGRFGFPFECFWRLGAWLCLVDCEFCFVGLICWFAIFGMILFLLLFRVWLLVLVVVIFVMLCLLCCLLWTCFGCVEMFVRVC